MTTRARSWMLIGAVALAVLVSSTSCRRGGGEAEQAAARQLYYCPMHPDFISPNPDELCPVCNMRLAPLEGTPGPPSPTMDPAAASQGIVIDLQRQQLTGVTHATAEFVPATVVVRARGHVAPDEGRIAHVHSRVSGYIQEVFADFVGKSVRRGEPLLTIYSPELVAAQQELLVALRAADRLSSASFEWARDDQEALAAAARQRLLLWGMSPGEVDRIESTGEVQHAVTMASPLSGVVTERAAYSHGRAVTPELDLYTIVDLSKVWVIAKVSESDLPHVRVGQRASLSGLGGERLEGTVAFVAPFVDPATRTVEARVEVANPGLMLKTNQWVEVALQEDLGPQLVVPQSAVIDTGRVRHVFIDRGGGRIEPRAVEIGPLTEQGRVITAGLGAGARVVVSAQFLIDSESRIRGALESWGVAAAPAGASAP